MNEPILDLMGLTRDQFIKIIDGYNKISYGLVESITQNENDTVNVKISVFPIDNDMNNLANQYPKIATAGEFIPTPIPGMENHDPNPAHKVKLFHSCEEEVLNALECKKYEKYKKALELYNESVQTIEDWGVNIINNTLRHKQKTVK